MSIMGEFAAVYSEDWVGGHVLGQPMPTVAGGKRPRVGKP